MIDDELSHIDGLLGLVFFGKSAPESFGCVYHVSHGGFPVKIHGKFGKNHMNGNPLYGNGMFSRFSLSLVHISWIFMVKNDGFRRRFSPENHGHADARCLLQRGFRPDEAPLMGLMGPCLATKSLVHCKQGEKHGELHHF